MIIMMMLVLDKRFLLSPRALILRAPKAPEFSQVFEVEYSKNSSEVVIDFNV